MKVIATREKSPIVFYMISFILGLIIIAIGANSKFAFSFIGIILSAMSIYFIVVYLNTPKEIIKLNENNELILPKNIKLSCSDLIDISYRKATAKGYSYSYGKIIISSKKGTYKYNFVKDCEGVCKELTRLMYENKEKSIS